MSASALSWCVDAKAIYDFVPDRCECRDQKRFTKRYPNVVDHEVPAKEIFDAKVVRRLDGAGMLPQPCVQFISRFVALSKSSFAGSLGDRFADVDRKSESAVGVGLRYDLIRTKVTHIVKCVYSGSLESLNGWERVNGCAKECVANTLPKVDFVEGIVWGTQPRDYLNAASRAAISPATVWLRSTGTALPNCRMASLHTPHKKYLSGNVCNLADSRTVK